jgi:hypothetical protein
MRLLLLAWAATAALGALEQAVVNDPEAGLTWIPDRTSQESWRTLFEPAPVWPERDVAALAVAHPARLPTLWTARLLYRGEAWTRREGEPTSARRWRATDRAVKLAILSDIRIRREPALAPALAAFLAREDGDPGLAASALAAWWLLSPADGRAAALRIADPRRADRLPAAGLPAARMYALRLLLEDRPSEGRRGAVEWALLGADGTERLAALSRLPPGTDTDLVAACLIRLAESVRAGRLDDDGTAAAVLACAALGEAVGEQTARTLAELAATAPRELACAAAAALARIVTWRNAIDPAPIAQRLARESDPAVRHALLAVLLRVSPARIATVPGAGGWADLARHRLALQDWEWQRYVR